MLMKVNSLKESTSSRLMPLLFNGQLLIDAFLKELLGLKLKQEDITVAFLHATTKEGENNSIQVSGFLETRKS